MMEVGIFPTSIAWTSLLVPGIDVPQARVKRVVRWAYETIDDGVGRAAVDQRNNRVVVDQEVVQLDGQRRALGGVEFGFVLGEQGIIVLVAVTTVITSVPLVGS